MTSPETEPDFYSMPLIKAYDAFPILNRNFEGNYAAALDDMIKLSNLALKRKEQVVKKNEGIIDNSKKELLSDPSLYFGLRSNTSGYTELSRHDSKSIDTCAPLLSSCSKDTIDLASCVRRESVFGKSLSDSSLMVLQSLHEPILSPSISSFSLDEMSKQQGSLEINTDTIFSDQEFDGKRGLEEKFISRHIYARLAW